MILAAASVAGALLFLWPFVLAGAPAPVASVSLALGSVAVLAAVETAARRLDARRFALLAAIAGIDTALRLVLVTGIGGFSPVFFLILASGYVFGPSFGFLCGTTSLLASAVGTGGIGPWLPYEMFGCGWMGLAAGAAGLRRRGAPGIADVAVLIVVSLVTGYVYGALLDVWDWTVFYRGTPGFGFLPGAPTPVLLGRFARFYLATSVTWDSFRAVGDAAAVAVLGAPVLAGLARLRSRLTFAVIPGSPAASGGPAAAAAAAPPDGRPVAAARGRLPGSPAGPPGS